MVKAEIGAFAGTNVQADAEINQLIANEQQWLASEHPMFLEQRYDVTAPANTQYLALPTTTAGAPSTVALALNLDYFPTVEVYYNLVYQPVIYGISSPEYNCINFAKSQQADPIQRWSVRSNVNESNNPNMFEVWPVPVTTQTLRFTGIRRLQHLFEGGDGAAYIANTADYLGSGETARTYLDSLTADLDDIMLMLFVAAKRLARNKAADASLKLQQAQRRYQTLTQNAPMRKAIRTLDGPANRNSPRLNGMRIMVGGGGTATTPTTTYMLYYGVSANTTLTEAQVLALASASITSRATTQLFSPTTQYIYLCYPASLGAATFTVNGFPSTAWVLTVVTVNSVSYNVYRSLNLLTGTNYSIVIS